MYPSVHGRGGAVTRLALATWAGHYCNLTGPHMTRFNCTTAELVTPEFLRLLAIASYKEKKRQERLEAGRRALAAANKLKNDAVKKYHQSRIFRALNKLRAA